MSAQTPAAPAAPLPFTRRPAFWAGLTVLALGLAAITVTSVVRPRAEPLPKLGTLPDFTFTRESGSPWGMRQLHGRPFVANFIFTRCPTICPAFTRRMARVQAETQRYGAGLQLVSFSVDPTYDTPERLAEYAQRHGANPERWSFLTGDYERLKHTVVNSFKIAMGRESLDEADVMGIFHGNHFVLVDAQGEIRGYYDSADDDAFARLLKDLPQLTQP
jgi:protein SCO1/2